jgi:hypothetical protein
MATKGYFIITDISGYTEYLTKSELEHAHAIMHSLFDAQLAHIKFPLHISGYAGDAILMYVPEAEFMNPQSLVEVLENVYISFSETLQQMILNTTCTCNACKNIKLLDLKAVVHYGEYMIQQLGNKDELLRMIAVMHANGIDVIQDIVLNHMSDAGSASGEGPLGTG